MSKPSNPICVAASLASLLPIRLELLWRNWSASQAKTFSRDWSSWARAEQKPPHGDWRTWLFLGGRGSGKTRAGAEWVAGGVRLGRFARVALIAPTFQDAREVMIEGRSGLRFCEGDRPEFEVSRRRLIWPNGATAYAFSAEDPESLRGPQFDAAWCDEFAYWAYPDETLQTLSHALRLGERPRMLVTTTPRPIAALKHLIAAPDTIVTHAPTWDNAANLAESFVVGLRARWQGSTRDRQEILGELIEDPEGAMWTRALIEAARTTSFAEPDRIVVAVDPPVSEGPRANACGIVAAGSYDIHGDGDERFVVLADASVRGLAPGQWAERAAALATSLGAATIIAEANQGGALVRAALALAAPNVAIKLTHAHMSKRARAEPVAMLYQRGLVSHANGFPELEDEMCTFGAPGFKGSPDRMDALVWALSELAFGAHPIIRRV